MPTSTPAKPKKLAASDLKFSNEKQRITMSLILEHFKRFHEREQHYYLLEGMSTYHIMKDVIETPEALWAFWPRELIIQERDRLTGGTRTTYQIPNDNSSDNGVFSKVNSGVRAVLDQLAKKGYLEKVGNEDERRWMPVKALRGVTL